MRARFVVQEAVSAGRETVVRGEEFHHAARVLRLRVGEEVEVIDRAGISAMGRVTEIGHESLTVMVEEMVVSRESPLRMTLALALIAPEKFELVLQKGTELGVSRFIPLITARTEVRAERVAGKRERWEKIVLEAVKQSGRSIVPEVEPPVTFDEVLKRDGEKVLLDAEHPTTSAAIAGNITLLVGPEGGWTEEEIERAVRAGAKTQRLGPRRLRAETAAIVAAAFFASRYGDLS
jgi:16S rRNA (uracil1498-N3)-methyltransferase